MPQATTYNPDNAEQFSKKALNFNGQGVMASCTPGQNTNLDLALKDDHLLTGIEYIIVGANFGDFFNLQVVDRDGTYYPAGTVLNQFATNWYVSPQAAGTPLEVPYPAKIPAGLVIRLVYTSTGTTAVQMAVNFEVHKVLI